jgi:hypothetical protein
MDLKIVEANGWAKVVQVQRAITRVGSADSNDIQLPSAQVAPLQLQILYAPDLPSSCRLVNLGPELLLLRNDSELAVTPFQIIDIFDGDQVDIGSYKLVFQLPLASHSVQISKLIEASLVFPEAVLHPDSILTGILRVKNTGERQGVQFQVNLNGLPHDCYQIDPIPLMYPGAEEEVQVRLFHRTTAPPAGNHELLLTVTAPVDYASEELVIRQGLYVTPVLKHELTILDSYTAAVPAEKTGVVELIPLVPGYAVPGTPDWSPDKARESVARSRMTTSKQASENVLPPSGPAPSTPDLTLQDQPKVKVVRSQSTDIWDE